MSYYRRSFKSYKSNLYNHTPKRSQKGSGNAIYNTMMKMANVKGVDTLFSQEYHAPLVMQDGSLQVASFMGPGTQINKRLQDKGKTAMDELSKRHDALYSLAKTPQDVQKADKDFLDKAQNVKDHPFNKKAGIGGIRAKYEIEKRIGVKFPSKKELASNNPNDKALLKIVKDSDKLYEQSGAGVDFNKMLKFLMKIINWIWGKTTPSKPSPEPPKPEEAQEPAKPEEPPLKSKCKILLEQHGITDRKSYRRWALSHHPDKVSPENREEATKLFQDVLNCLQQEKI